MAWTSVPDRAIGYALAETDWDTSIRDNLNSGAWVTLGSTKLTAAAATLDFTGIPATFAHLMVIAYLRGDTAAGLITIFQRFNNDSGANYDWQNLGGNGAAASGFESFATTGGFDTAPAATAPANLFAGVRMVIPHYANAANNKALVRTRDAKAGTSSLSLSAGPSAGFWRSNAAINRVTLLPAAGNWAAGSAATVLGLP